MRALLTTGLALVLAAAAGRAESLGENLVRDGGMETWTATGPSSPWWDHLAVEHKAWTFAKDGKGDLLTPGILSQLYEGSVMKPESEDVHGGGKALRLKGQFYLNGSRPDAYLTHEGDEYVARYWVKGSGQTTLWLHVYGEGGAQIVKRAGNPVPGKWTLMEERIQVTGAAPTTVYPRLYTSEEMLVDDLSIRKVVKEGGANLPAIPPELAARGVFASDTRGGDITIDGRLDEPGWAKAVKAGGMRCYQDQTRLAPQPSPFRVLFDGQALYLGVEARQPDCAQILEGLKRDPLRDAAGKLLPQDGTYTGRHSLELFLQAPGSSRYCQFVVSLDGYRYDGAGMDASWDGKWESAVRADAGGWVAEIKIPAADFGLGNLSPGSLWRLNLCVNRNAGEASTWAAVGSAFHNPEAFGTLILEDFGEWRAAQAAGRAAAERWIKANSREGGLAYGPRLSAIASYLRRTGGDAVRPLDWEAITRSYGVLSFADYSFQCMRQEINYDNSFERARK